MSVLFVVDLSHHNAEAGLPRSWFDAAKAAGVAAVITKTSQGEHTIDNSADENIARARDAGLLATGYHYVDAAADPGAQMDTYLAQLRRCGLDPVAGCGLALDVEQGSGTRVHARACRDALAARVGADKVVLDYDPHWYWAQTGGALWGPLWSSRYLAAAGSVSALYGQVPASWWAGYGGVEVALLQFTDKANVGGRSVDCSAFRGTAAELAVLFNEGDDMPTADEIAAAVVGRKLSAPDYPDGEFHNAQYSLGDFVTNANAKAAQARNKAQEAADRVAALDAKVSALAGMLGDDEAHILAAIQAAAGSGAGPTDVQLQHVADFLRANLAPDLLQAFGQQLLRP